MRILLVEEESDLRRFLSKAITESGHQVDCAESGRMALRLSAEVTYHCCIVDGDDVDECGLPLIADLRRAGMIARTLVVSSPTTIEQRVRILENGAEDHLTKPFALAEFLARLRNLLPRHGSTEHTNARLQVLDLELDLMSREVRRAGRLLRLSTQEFAVLEFLCRNAGRVVTRAMIMEGAWGIQSEANPSAVDVLISRLRAKVDISEDDALIHTLRGFGYVLRNVE